MIAGRVAACVPKLQRVWRDGEAVALAVLGSAYLLKLAYSRAGAADLAWVLAPSGWLAGRLGGIDFAWEAHAGYVSHAPRLVVGPPCAGVNFLMVAWLATYFAAHGALRGAGRRAVWWAGSGVLAYAATVCTNALRIVLAAHMLDAPLHSTFLTPARLHRLLGVVVYSAALFALCRAVTRRAQGTSAAASLRAHLGWFGWYLAVTLGVPVVNRVLVHDARRFTEHAAWTVAVAAGVLVVWWVGGRFVHRLCSRNLAA